MKTIFRLPGIGGLLFAQSQVAFNDNATKLILIGLVQMLLPADDAERMVSAIALLLVAPFVIFAPLSGWVADRFPKRRVLAASLWLQLAVMALLFFAVCLHALPLAIGGFFLLGIQSALMSPARRGMVKELAGNSVGEVIGWMEMLCIAAILGGSLGGGQLIDGLTGLLKNPWLAAGSGLGVLIVTCAGAIIAFRRVPSHHAGNHQPFTSEALLGHRQLFGTLRENRSIWLAALGDAAFYLAGGVVMLTLAQIGRQLHPDGLGAARATGIMMATMGVGIASGSVTAARLSRHRINLGLAPVGAAGMAIFFFAIGAFAPGSLAFFGLLFLLGICGGLYLVPLGALLVDRAPEEKRGRILAASSMLSSIAGVIAVALHALLSGVFHLSPSAQFAVLGFGLLGVTVLAVRLLPQDLLRMVALFLARLRYTVAVRGAKNLPAKGGALIVCNHVTYVDTIILSLASRRPIRFLSYEGFFRAPVLGPILRIFGAIPVSSSRAREAIVRAAERVAAGELVCIFPEGQLTRTGCLMELKSGFELIARRAQSPVVVAHLDGLWGSIFSFAGGRYFTKLPHGLRRRPIVSFSPPLAAGEATTPRVRESMLALGEAAFRSRPCRRDLAGALLEALDENPWRIAVVDPSASAGLLRNAPLLGMAALLARHWRKSIPEMRIGVILPPGQAGTLVNLGLILAGKIPANLNPTMAPAAAQACLDQAGIRTLITATAAEAKLARFPWPAHVLLIEKEIAQFPHFTRDLAATAAALLPLRLGKRLLHLPAPKPDQEAVLLFTSGTSGWPKGVALTHRQVLANAAQVAETGFLRADDRILTALPLFHSFGLTMGLLMPLLTRRTVITAPSPLDADKIAEAGRQGSPTVLLATPTFLRCYLKRIPRDAFGTLRLAATGAERLPAATADAFRDRFGCEVLEGYGLTETAPVVSFNMPAPRRGLGADSLQLGSRAGTAGRLLPGLAFQLLDPETGDALSGAKRGVLALRGANIIESYLDDTGADRFRGGWFVTGDVASLDAEGFLTIEGRTSRFSKVGGEMVSHTAVEQAIAEAFPAEKIGAQDCVLGIPSAEKGEDLVLLTTRHISAAELRQRLDLPNLWIPKTVVQIPALPLLATGKLDLAGCRRLLDNNLVRP